MPFNFLFLWTILIKTRKWRYNLSKVVGSVFDLQHFSANSNLSACSEGTADMVIDMRDLDKVVEDVGKDTAEVVDDSEEDGVVDKVANTGGKEDDNDKEEVGDKVREAPFWFPWALHKWL